MRKGREKGKKVERSKGAKTKSWKSVESVGKGKKLSDEFKGRKEGIGVTSSGIFGGKKVVQSQYGIRIESVLLGTIGISGNHGNTSFILVRLCSLAGG